MRAGRFAENVADLRRLGVPLATRKAINKRVRAGLRFNGLRYLPDGALRDVRWVVDVGANQGDWTAGVLSMAAPRGVVAIEPDPRLVTRLRSRFNGSVQVVGAAATDGACDRVALNLTDASWANSLLPPREAEMNAAYGAGYTVADQVEVPAITIDEASHAADEVTLLKLDVQGSELAALAGAKATLDRTRYAQLEVLFYSHYEGDALFQDLFDVMTGHDFELMNLSPPLVLDGRAMWSDAFFGRRD